MQRNWESVTTQDLLRNKGGRSVINFYENSLAKALCDIYPGIGLETKGLGHVTSMSQSIHVSFIFSFNKFSYSENFCHEPDRRSFFQEFAIARNFDPNISENWYSVSPADVLGTKVCD